MKSLTIRFTAEEAERLRRIKALGFSTSAEVIKCAALSLCTWADTPDPEFAPMERTHREGLPPEHEAAHPV
jgi:hypothetical protein